MQWVYGGSLKRSLKPATTLLKIVGTEKELFYRLKKLSFNVKTNSSITDSKTTTFLGGPISDRVRGINANCTKILISAWRQSFKSNIDFNLSTVNKHSAIFKFLQLHSLSTLLKNAYGRQKIIVTHMHVKC